MNAPLPAETTPVEELIGIYHANGTFAGEVSYWIKARLGRGHCALCDITHGSVREKATWRQCRDELAVPFSTVHLDERDPELVSLTDRATPCIVARTSRGELVILVDAAELARCEGAPDRLVASLGRRARELGLDLEPS